jgi:hypothetical protein
MLLVRGRYVDLSYTSFSQPHEPGALDQSNAISRLCPKRASHFWYLLSARPSNNPLANCSCRALPATTLFRNRPTAYWPGSKTGTRSPARQLKRSCPRGASVIKTHHEQGPHQVHGSEQREHSSAQYIASPVSLQQTRSSRQDLT